ncbi:40-kDa huntingtin-associated protein isoform X3, partial [Canis lupus familiaris]|uniref:40-kDa huntingtin-associated protein isoform X3 n=1 Tax=Canis lupus familiaris TaxID=9615 RepID=UPI0018F646B7
GGGGGAGPGPEAGDFLARYRQVSSKLRKRFLRKPNVAEAGEQFAQLGRELRAQECLPYAAWCQLAVARCQQALFHGPGEALALTEAARLFLRQERDARQRLACPAAYGEPLQAAASALGAAVRLHLELGQPAAAAGLCLELAAALRDLGQPAAAAGHFLRAAQLHLPQLPLAALQALGDAASCQLLARDYSGALAVFTRMQRLAREHGSHPLRQPPPAPPPPAPPLPPAAAPALPAALLPAAPAPTPTPAPATLGAFSDVLVRCEVSRVLLLLLLQPPPAKLLPEHAHTLEKYSWEAFDGHGPDGAGQLPDELFLLLQSLVMATHEKDTEAVKSLQVDMWPLLSAEQNHLLHLVLQEAVSPVGAGRLTTRARQPRSRFPPLAPWPAAAPPLDRGPAGRPAGRRAAVPTDRRAGARHSHLSCSSPARLHRTLRDCSLPHPTGFVPSLARQPPQHHGVSLEDLALFPKTGHGTPSGPFTPGLFLHPTPLRAPTPTPTPTLPYTSVASRTVGCCTRLSVPFFVRRGSALAQAGVSPGAHPGSPLLPTPHAYPWGALDGTGPRGCCPKSTIKPF